MKRLLFLLAVPIAVATIGIGAQDRTFPIVVFRHSFYVVEATIPVMQAALESGRLTRASLCCST